MTFNVHTEFQWKPSKFFYNFALCDISYERMDLCRPQHTIICIILGVGFTVFFQTGKPCSDKKMREIWGDDIEYSGEDVEYSGKKKISTVKRKRKKK